MNKYIPNLGAVITTCQRQTEITSFAILQGILTEEYGLGTFYDYDKGKLYGDYIVGECANGTIELIDRYGEKQIEFQRVVGTRLLLPYNKEDNA